MKKKIIALVMTLVMIMTGGIYLNASSVDTKADENQWITDGIVAPQEDSLIAAGYIDIEFDNSVANAKTYQVYFDNKPIYEKDGQVVRTELDEDTAGATERVYDAKTCGEKIKCEVYTTDVAKHTVYVLATFENGTFIKTNERTFYVSKKGLALGGDMSDKISLKKLNASWYYNWATTAFENSIDEDVAHVPMMWGDGDDNKEAMKDLQSNSNYVLGFNEPDIGTQANMNVAKGIRVWNEYILPLGKRTVSPAPANPNGASQWITDFLNGLTVFKTEDGEEMKYLPGDPGEPYFLEGTDCDAIAVHYYRGTTDVEGLLTSVKSVWDAYHKPIWVTEVSVMGRKGTTYDYSYDAPGAREKVKTFVEGMVENLDSLPYVERYAWFPYDVESKNDIDDINGAGATAMFEYASGLYTDLGIRYSEIGNPEGYNSYHISNDERFVWENRIIPPTDETETTTEQVTTTQPLTEQVTTKSNSIETTKKSSGNIQIGKASIKKIRNIKKKTVSLTWKKVAKAKKYKVQYARDKKFKKVVKAKTVKGLNIKIKGLKKGKTYYFRVCGISGKKQGNWSKTKKIKIKR